MKTQKKTTKLVVLLLVFVMAFQSCTVYKSKPITLGQVAQNNSKVRIITNSNKTFVYKKIVFDGVKYYGLKRIKGKKVKISINQDLVKSINEKNKTLSTLLSVGIPIVIIGGLLVLSAQKNSDILVLY